MKIAVMGTRGIPARYGGFENFAEELSVRLTRRGHEVTVYCRSRHCRERDHRYRGVRRVLMPEPAKPFPETMTYTVLCLLHAIFCRYDAVLICRGTNAGLAWLPRLAAQKVAVSVDGIHPESDSGSPLRHLARRLADHFAFHFPNKLITDSEVIAEYFRQHYGVQSAVIPYGSRRVSPRPGAGLGTWNLQPRQYLLYVGTLQPQNHAHTVIAAYRKSHVDIPLLLVGDAQQDANYMTYIREQVAMAGPVAGSNVILAGIAYGSALEELMCHSAAFIQSTETGGTHPALLQAMGAGGLVIANDTPDHLRALGDAGLYYRFNNITDLSEKIRDAVHHPDNFQSFRSKAQERIEASYSWDLVADRYETLFRAMAS
ncbi:MAG TPA: glycosyltransferase [Acidobacteriota bacterium]|nr:glycosyltransferase [Acidobacteriota bacterium]